MIEPRRAVTDGDLAWAQLRQFATRVETAILDVRRAAEIGKVGVSFSGGKDSLVLLDLVRRVLPDAPAALYDSGCELRGTLDIVKHYGVDVVTPRMTFPEMARYSGWWGYEPAVDPGCPFPVKTVIIDEPSEAFVVKRGLRVMAIGLRAEESAGRTMNARQRGTLYEAADRTWHLCPLAFWKTADVWAYIASRGLRYHSAYDAMTEMGIPREDQRLGALLGEKGAGMGKYSTLRKIEPETWRALVREFPMIRMCS